MPSLSKVVISQLLTNKTNDQDVLVLSVRDLSFVCLGILMGFQQINFYTYPSMDVFQQRVRGEDGL